jgi:hypothetical protein
MTFNTSSGICALPSHRPLIASPARQGNAAATIKITINRTRAPTAVIN